MGESSIGTWEVFLGHSEGTFPVGILWQKIIRLQPKFDVQTAVGGDQLKGRGMDGRIG
jgi:hypothetical protein